MDKKNRAKEEVLKGLVKIDMKLSKEDIKNNPELGYLPKTFHIAKNICFYLKYSSLDFIKNTIY